MLLDLSRLEFMDSTGLALIIRAEQAGADQTLLLGDGWKDEVLELSGGVCARLGIHVGDRIEHRLFGAAAAGPVIN